MKMYVFKNSFYFIGPMHEVLEELKKIAKENVLVKDALNNLLH